MNTSMVLFRRVMLLTILVLVPVQTGARVSRSWPTMGTFAEVVVASDSESRAGVAIESVRDVFDRINRTMTVYDPQSDLSRANRWAGHRAVSVDPWVADLIAKARRASIVTDGAFSVDVLAEGMARGLKPRTVNAVPPGGKDRFIRVSTNPARLYLPFSSMALDLGGIAKGYALDQAREVLEERGFDRYLINLGRNIAVGRAPVNTQGWPVRITGEDRTRRLTNQTLSISEQGVRSDTPHIITNEEESSSGVRRSVVSAREGWIADMASTALLVKPALGSRLKRGYSSIQWVRVDRTKQKNEE